MKNFKLLMESWRGFKKTITERTAPHYGETYEELRNAITEAKDSVWIFFDTETTGLKPEKDYNQVTQIAAVAVKIHGFAEGTSPTIIGQFNQKIALTDRTKSFMKWEKEKEAQRIAAGEESKFKTTPEILAMTSYGEPRNPREREKRKLSPEPTKYHTIEEAMNNFVTFCNQYPDKILLAQNAPFDVGYVNEMFKRFGATPPDDIVYDTVPIFKQYLAKTVDLKGINMSPGESMSSEDLNQDPETHIIDGLDVSQLFSTNKAGRKFMSVSLGKLIHAFNIENKGWHDALADVVMLCEVLGAAIKWLDKQPEVHQIRNKPRQIGPETEPPPPKPRAGKASDVE
jgi:DNA polymerase III epsilon subunit-like protein